MKRIFLLKLLFLASLTYGQKNIIFGDLKGFQNGDKVSIESPELQKTLDSTIIKNGKFSLKALLNKTPQGYYLDIISGSNFYYCYLFIANENIKITGDKIEFPYDLTITGSKNHSVRNNLNLKTKQLQKERDKVVSFLRADVLNKNDSTYKIEYKKNSKRLKEIDKTTDSIKKSFITDNLNTYYGLNELYNLRSRYDSITLKKMYSNLKPVFKNSIYGERILNYLKVGDALKKGNQYFDFEAKDITGKSHKISEFSGKYILLDFTETYCGPCIESVEELKMVSKTYHDSLIIISFCADKSELVWKKGINRDKINWLSLWDGNGNYGNTLLKYGVQGYPTFFLIDKTGKIFDIQKSYQTGAIEKKLMETLPILHPQ